MTDARVENQLFRFTPATTLDPQRVVDEIGGKRSGRYVTLSLVAPRATLLVDQDGRIIVHGCRKQDLAHLAAKEVLLRLGEAESGMTFEVGPVVASFDFESTVSLEGVPDLYPEAVMDSDSIVCESMTPGTRFRCYCSAMAAESQQKPGM